VLALSFGNIIIKSSECFVIRQFKVSWILPKILQSQNCVYHREKDSYRINRRRLLGIHLMIIHGGNLQCRKHVSEIAAILGFSMRSRAKIYELKSLRYGDNSI